MSEPKLANCFIGTGITWGLAAISWNQIATFCAILATLASLWAAVETALWRRKQRKMKGLNNVSDT